MGTGSSQPDTFAGNCLVRDTEVQDSVALAVLVWKVVVENSTEVVVESFIDRLLEMLVDIDVLSDELIDVAVEEETSSGSKLVDVEDAEEIVDRDDEE